MYIYNHTRRLQVHTITPFRTHAQGLEGWLAIVDGVTVGHIFMQLEPEQRIKFLDAWVHPSYRRQGIFRSLWETRWGYVCTTYPDHTVYAWCLPESLPLLLEKGFTAGDVCTYVERPVTLTNNTQLRIPYGDCPVTC